MYKSQSYIGGRFVSSKGLLKPIVNPATGEEIGQVYLAPLAEVDAAVDAAKAAFPGWSSMGLQSRANIVLDLRQRLVALKDELAEIIVAETGKAISDARAEMARAIEAAAVAVNATTLYETPYSRGASSGVNTYEVRFPVGVVAAISPFNFPVNIPIVQTMMALVCGNTVVAKPSDRNPTALLRLADEFVKAGLPAGVFNVLVGDHHAVNRAIDHPDVNAITFVGSTPVARDIRKRGVAHNKRVQAFGGGKNHCVVMPDADVDLVSGQVAAAAFGAAGQRCMAISVLVAVGDVADPLVERIKKRAAEIKMGDLSSPSAELGPVISQESLQRIHGILSGAEAEGASIVLDGRNHSAGDSGWYIGPTLVDNVKPGMTVHNLEVFGPVLCVVRVDSYEKAMEVISGHELGNGASIYTQSGAYAERFTNEVSAGQVGINIPIPVPVFFHGFAGWKDSAFTETKLHGRDTLAFMTRTKTVSARWLSSKGGDSSLHFPSSK